MWIMNNNYPNLDRMTDLLWLQMNLSVIIQNWTETACILSRVTILRLI